MPYLSSIALCDLLGCGVKLALQLAALLPIIKHLHLVGTKQGATHVNSKEVTLLCNTSGQLSPVVAEKHGPDAMLKVTVRGSSLTMATSSFAPSWQVLICKPGISTRKEQSWQTLARASGPSCLLAMWQLISFSACFQAAEG